MQLNRLLHVLLTVYAQLTNLIVTRIEFLILGPSFYVQILILSNPFNFNLNYVL